MLPVPLASELPEYPASWYLFGPAHRLYRGPFSRDLCGRRVVVYRTQDGKLVALDARCTHLGADLGEGCVVGEEIRCAFHHWRYGPDGRCTRISGADNVPAFARLRRYAVAERHGSVFVFNGPEALFPLPFFDDADAAGLVAGRPLRYGADCPWYMVNGNSFDVQHFRTEHHRELIGTPQIDCPHPFARRIRLTFGVAGGSIFDRLLRGFVGRRVEVSLTNWGGSVVVVSGRFQRAVSRLMIFTEPVSPERCSVVAFVFAPRQRWRPVSRPVERLSLWLRRLFTHGFMVDEFTTLAGIRYNPAGLVESDRPLADFFHWVSTLPTGAENPRSGPALGRPCSAGVPFSRSQENIA